MQYFPLPNVWTSTEVPDKDELMIVTDSLGEPSGKYSYSHGQLKYLAWQVTKALQYIHNMGFVHGLVSPTTIRCIPDKRQVCLAGFSVHGMYDEIPITNHKGQADPVWDMHKLAYSLIVLAGGTLPWSTAKTQQEVKLAEFVARYSSCLDDVLLEWVKQALSLQGMQPFVYGDVLDYLWQ